MASELIPIRYFPSNGASYNTYFCPCCVISEYLSTLLCVKSTPQTTLLCLSKSQGNPNVRLALSVKQQASAHHTINIHWSYDKCYKIVEAALLAQLTSCKTH